MSEPVCSIRITCGESTSSARISLNGSPVTYCAALRVVMQPDDLARVYLELLPDEIEIDAELARLFQKRRGPAGRRRKWRAIWGCLQSAWFLFTIGFRRSQVRP